MMSKISAGIMPESHPSRPSRRIWGKERERERERERVTNNKKKERENKQRATPAGHRAESGRREKNRERERGKSD